jgi:hypothetical protein
VSIQFQCCYVLVVCRSSFRVVVSWSCVNPVSSGLCGNPSCLSTLDRMVVCQHSIHSPFNDLIFGMGSFTSLSYLVANVNEPYV